MSVYVAELATPYKSSLIRHVDVQDLWNTVTQKGRTRRLAPNTQEDITPQEIKTDEQQFQYLVTAYDTPSRTGSLRLRRHSESNFVMGTVINTRAGKLDFLLAPVVFQIAPNPPVSQKFLSVAYEKGGNLLVPTVVFYGK